MSFAGRAYPRILIKTKLYLQWTVTTYWEFPNNSEATTVKIRVCLTVGTKLQPEPKRDVTFFHLKNLLSHQNLVISVLNEAIME